MTQVRKDLDALGKDYIEAVNAHGDVLPLSEHLDEWAQCDPEAAPRLRELLRLAELAEEKGGTLAVVDTNQYPVALQKIIDDQTTRSTIRAERWELVALTGYRHIIALAEAAGEVAEPPDSCPEASCPERRGDCHKCYVQPHWAAGDAGARS